MNKCTNLSRAARAIARGIRLLCRRSQRKNASAPLPVYCSLRSLRLALVAAAFITRSQTKKTCLLAEAQHGGARFPTLAAEVVADARS